MRRSLFSVVLLIIAPLAAFAGEFGFNNSERYSGSPWQKAQNHSTSTWSDYANPWDYFQPVDYSGRNRMRGWAEELYRRAAVLEAETRQEARKGGSRENLKAVDEAQELRLAAFRLREDLRFGIHQGDLSADIDQLSSVLEQKWWRKSTAPAVERHKSEIDELTGRIMMTAGPRLLMENELPGRNNPKNRDLKPSATQSQKPKAVGLSGKKR